MSNHKTKTRKKLNIKVFAKRGLVCCALIYICFLLIFQQFDLARLKEKENDINEQISVAQREATELAAQKEAAGTDEYVERVAREKLGYMKPGEKVFIDASK